jgi:uncharacterized protein
MYHQVISQCTQSLKNLETCLDKAEQYAIVKSFDVGVLMTSRLAPDMHHFIHHRTRELQLTVPKAGNN